MACGVLLALLKVLEYQYFVRAYPGEVYGGLLVVIFSVLGSTSDCNGRGRARWWSSRRSGSGPS